MAFHVWLAFAAASTVLLLIPGPTVLLVLSYALGQGWRAALPVALGVVLGDFTSMTASVLGLGALLAASSSVFAILKWIGAAYLVWLGIKLWRDGGTPSAEPRTDRATGVTMLGHAWIVTALNPKAITFFVAFLPQFIDAGAPLGPQLVLFEATFLVLAFANVLGYAAAASRARRMVGDRRTLRMFNKVGGSLLIGAGLATAGLRTS